MPQAGALYDTLTTLPTGGNWTSPDDSLIIPVTGSRSIQFRCFVQLHASAAGNTVQFAVEFSNDKSFWFPASQVKPGSTSLGNDSVDTVALRYHKFRTTDTTSPLGFVLHYNVGDFAYARIRAKETEEASNPAYAQCEYVLTSKEGQFNPVDIYTPFGGDIVGPGSSTDNAIVRWDGTTGQLVQDSSLTITDGGMLRVISGWEIQDANSNELIMFPTSVASAVNNIKVSNSATGVGAKIESTGADTNIDLLLATKGTGQVNINTVPKRFEGCHDCGGILMPWVGVGNGAANFTFATNGTAYFTYLGRSFCNVVIPYIELGQRVAGTSITYAEIAILSSTVPSSSGNTLTLRGAAAITMTGTGKIRNGSALTYEAPAGTYLYLGVMYSGSGTDAAVIVLGTGFISDGSVQTTAGATQFTTGTPGTTTYTGAIQPIAAGASSHPAIWGAMV